ncbi:MAG: T9SS type A sorting domain-containing protein [Bacteroidales bacterium]|nr:T9SS type A sorting domain-containing protein [Bacteroidales bacterium]MCF8334306.1 T9SS type A sorting domain-containing protein [Bacteroidales bacterium]
MNFKAQHLFSVFIAAIFLMASVNTHAQDIRTTSKEVNDMITFSKSTSSEDGEIYEILPGRSVINPSMEGTPFSDSTTLTTGEYSLQVEDVNDVDSPDSEDAVTSVNITFTASNGQQLLIDDIHIIHKPADQGDHTFFGGVGFNKIMHGNTGIGVPLMPKLMSYITLWGKTDLKDAETDTVVAADRLIHIMTSTDVRNEDKELLTSTEVDSSDYNIRKAHTHVILPPKNMADESDPVPGTDHGFIHMMWEDVNLEEPNRDWGVAYEILPGPAVINPQMSPTPFSNSVSLGSGSYSFKAYDNNAQDSPDSRDSLANVSIHYKRPNGTEYMIDNIQIIHKPEGQGDHPFFGGVGFDKIMHGNTGIGVPLMPKLFARVTLWGKADLKDGEGNVLAEDRLIHIMTGGRVRTDNLMLTTNTQSDESDHSQNETHIILPPKDTQDNPDPVPGTKHGFLHLMFEKASIDSKAAGIFDRELTTKLNTTNYPDPFTRQTTIRYNLPEKSEVTVRIYDMTGQAVHTLIKEQQMAGEHKIRFSPASQNIQGGMYFYRITADNYQGSGKMMFNR